ncbi:MAG: hypothetical protein AAGF78_02985 [Pseudomonadota bacterium]
MQPYIASAEDEPFSAEELNRRLNDVETAFVHKLRAAQDEVERLEVAAMRQAEELRVLADVAMRDREERADAVETAAASAQGERQATARAEKLESKLREMENSLSWKITEPLRQLRAMIKKGS